MIFLVLALLIVIPTMPAGYALPKLLVLSCGGFLLKAERRTSADMALVFGWYVLLVATLFSVDPFVSIVGRYNDWAHGLLGWGILTVFFLLGSQEERDLESLAWPALGLSVMAVAQRLIMPRATGTIGDPVGLGALLALLSPVVVLRFPRWWPLVLMGAIATGSRGAILGVIVGVLMGKRC